MRASATSPLVTCCGPEAAHRHTLVGGARDHINQVHLVGDALRGFIMPRWTRLAILEEEQKGTRPL